MQPSSAATPPTNNSAIARRLIAALLAALLAACAGGPPKKEPMMLTLQAAAEVNPDLQGRPSPVVVQILELKSLELFNSLDYMSLSDPSGAALSADLLNRNQVVLSPGASRQMELELDASTQAIGLIAGYRDIDNATWRQAVPISPGETKSITVNLGQAQMTTTTN